MMSMLSSTKQVFVKLNAEKTAICWATLEQANGKPVDGADIPLSDISTVAKKGADALVIRDKVRTAGVVSLILSVNRVTMCCSRPKTSRRVKQKNGIW